MKQCKLARRVGSTVLATVMAISMVGCSQSKETAVTPMEAEEVYALSFDAIGGEDVMPIMGYYGPRPTTNSVNGNDEPNWYTEEYFELIAGSGLNVIGCNYTYAETYPAQLDTMMNLAEQNNLGVLVNDRRVTAITDSVDDYVVDQFVGEYCGYPAYVGNYVVDEPDYIGFRGAKNSTRLVERYVPVFEELNELGYFAYGNLFPQWGGNKDKYEEYVRSYVETCKPQMLSYDMYPFDDNVGMARANEYFTNLDIIRQVAEDAKIPFWAFVQAGGDWNDAGNYFDTEVYYPAKGEFLWNVGTLLACGVKGMQYFPMIQPYKFANAESQVADTQRNALLSAYGNKTRWYYYAAETSAQVAAVDEVLMHAVNKGVIASGEDAEDYLAGTSYLMDGTSWRELKSVSGDAIVGCFNYQGKTALYVVNNDTQYAQNITLDFIDKYKVTVIQNAETQHVSQNNLELTFAPGGSALVVFG